MSKYDPLGKHLAQLDSGSWVATFPEIERVLGFRLPFSARNYPAWWANNRGTHVQTSAWLATGWMTEDLNLTAEHVTFRRLHPPVRASATARPRTHPPSYPSTAPPLSEMLPAVDRHGLSNAPRRLNGSFGMVWQPVGSISLDHDGRLKFPSVPGRPGLYCFRVHHDDREERYIGETENLSRRCTHYRNPGPTQETNIRVNARLCDALRKGARIAMETVTEGGWVNWERGTIPVDLSSKAARCFLEFAAILHDNGTAIATLNRHA